MGRARCSKHLANQQPEGELPAKRTPRLNTHTLEAFTSKQQALPKRKAPKKTSLILIESSLSPPLRERAQEKSVDMFSTPVTSSPSTLDDTPIARRTKPPPAFDPNSELNDYPHYVIITITPVINSSCKEAVIISIDINNVFRPDLDVLQAFVYKQYIQE